MHVIETAVGPVAFRELGDSGTGAAPVLAAHCAGSSGAQWKGLAEALGDGYRVLAPTLYGHGRTPPWPGDPQEPTRDFHLGDEAALLLEVARRSEGPVHVVGHSYGGSASLQLVLEHPERVRSLTLYEPPLYGILRATDPELFERDNRRLEALLETARQGEPAEAARRFVVYLSGEGAWEAMAPRPRDAMIALMAQTVFREARAQASDRLRLDDYRRVEAPTRILHGSRSPEAIARVCERLAGAIPGAELIRVEGAGHLGPSYEPELVLPLITDFIRGVC